MIENERIGSNCSPERTLCFNKRVPLFDKRALGQSRMTRRDWIPPNQKLFLISFIYILHFFFHKGTFNEVSKLWTLHLSKIGPGEVIFFEKIISWVCLFKSGLNDIFHWCIHSSIFCKSLFNSYAAVLASGIIVKSNVSSANNLTVDMIWIDRSLIWIRKITQTWRCDTPQNFSLAFIDELENNYLLNKSLKWANKKCKNFNICNVEFFFKK